MRKIVLFCLVLCAFFTVQAQELPYSKYLNFSKGEFKENHFKYDEETNTWFLRKSSGLKTTLNVLAIIADAEEEVRPARNDYSILVQLGKENRASYVKVLCYSDETYLNCLPL